MEHLDRESLFSTFQEKNSKGAWLWYESLEHPKWEFPLGLNHQAFARSSHSSGLELPCYIYWHVCPTKLGTWLSVHFAAFTVKQVLGLCTSSRQHLLRRYQSQQLTIWMWKQRCGCLGGRWFRGGRHCRTISGSLLSPLHRCREQEELQSVQPKPATHPYSPVKPTPGCPDQQIYVTLLEGYQNFLPSQTDIPLLATAP